MIVATITTVGSIVTPHYAVTDHLNSANVMTDTDGNQTELLDYYPYGSQRISSGSYTSARQFIGQEYDADTKLSYLNARYYDGATGKFLSEDPVFWGQQNLSDPQSLNSYSYSENNPITKSDPSGKDALMVGLAAYDVTAVWDFSKDVISNFNNSSIPWYSKLTPQDQNAAIRYNEDALGNAAIAVAASTTSSLLAPLVASGALLQGGSNILSASVAGLGSVVKAFVQGQLKNGRDAMTTFESGYFGDQAGNKISIPNTSNNALTETSKALVGQSTETVLNHVVSSPIKSKIKSNQ